MTIITLQGEQFTAIENELNAHFKELWQNVNSLDEMEVFTERIRACGLDELAESYVMQFWESVAEMNRLQQEERFNQHLTR